MGVGDFIVVQTPSLHSSLVCMFLCLAFCVLRPFRHSNSTFLIEDQACVPKLRINGRSWDETNKVVPRVCCIMFLNPDDVIRIFITISLFVSFLIFRAMSKNVC